MDDLQGAAQTIMKMSPPMLIIVAAAILNFLLKPFLPGKYLWLIAVLAGGAVAPYMFPHSSLAYSVPSPSTALVIVGAIMGFLGSVAHRKLNGWFAGKFLKGDTEFVTRCAVCPERLGQPSNLDGQRKSD